ncbi:hypothetical protein CERSUDRAFT_111270 [Gelatoporia subvermispora B]|uniref:Uncharacterized protein n=1 Tax=Ceriporiopsis subvermispora (strain B) TaxID=914234 RepID=M2R8F5_CERS8|nr:hypothetical protein CERSUDRAFT_111270 [Gelatoporia subvermispora B]
MGQRMAVEVEGEGRWEAQTVCPQRRVYGATSSRVGTQRGQCSSLRYWSGRMPSDGASSGGFGWSEPAKGLVGGDGMRRGGWGKVVRGKGWWAGGIFGDGLEIERGWHGSNARERRTARERSGSGLGGESGKCGGELALCAGDNE